MSVAARVEARVDEAAALDVIIDTGGRRLELQTYTHVLTEVRLALEEVDRLVIPGRRARPRWVIASLDNIEGARARLVPIVPAGRRPPDTLSLVSGGLVNGVNSLRDKAAIPRFFSPRTVGRVQSMGDRVGEGSVQQILLEDVGDKPQSGVVDASTVLNAQKAVAPAGTALSSVIGRLDVLSSRNKVRPRAQVYDERGRRAVTLIAAADHLDQLRAAWGERVLAAGLLTRNSAGQPLRLELMTLKVLGEPQAPIDPMQLLGIDPGATSDLSTQQYLDAVRDG